MTSPATAEHDALILDQFTRQAAPFAELSAHSPEQMMKLILRGVALEAQQRVLDVACGPGLLAKALAGAAAEVVGVDIVPAMLERARFEVERAGYTNVRFQQADARALPFEAGSFDRVVTRFSFHHLREPMQVLREMVRVAKPAGLVVVIDATPAPEARAAYDELELLRDPSHTSALTRAELEQLFVDAGLALQSTTPFALHMDLEQQLAASFPAPGGARRVRALLERDLRDGTDRMDLSPRREDGRIRFAYPCAIAVGRKAA